MGGLMEANSTSRPPTARSPLRWMSLSENHPIRPLLLSSGNHSNQSAAGLRRRARRGNMCCLVLPSRRPLAFKAAAPPCCTAQTLLHTLPQLLRQPPTTHTSSWPQPTPPPPLMFSCSQGFWGIQTNDLRWQRSVKASIRRQIQLIKSKAERLTDRLDGEVSPSAHTHHHSHLWQLTSWCQPGHRSCRVCPECGFNRNKPPGSNGEQGGLQCFEETRTTGVLDREQPPRLQLTQNKNDIRRIWGISSFSSGQMAWIPSFWLQ